MITERRAFERPVELREAPDGSTAIGILTGYAIVFNSLSRDLGGFKERIAPESVDLENNGRVMARDNHDSNGLLGTTDAGTLRLFIDDIGVPYEVDLPDTTRGRDVKVLAARGDYRYSSFAFRTPPGGDQWDYDENGDIVRTVTRLNLADIAPVADPAYWESSTEMKRDFDLDAIRASLRSEQAGTPPWVAIKHQFSARPRIY